MTVLWVVLAAWLGASFLLAGLLATFSSFVHRSAASNAAALRRGAGGAYGFTSAEARSQDLLTV